MQLPTTSTYLYLPLEIVILSEERRHSRRTQSKDLRFAGGGRLSPSRRTAGPSTRAEALGRDDNS